MKYLLSKTPLGLKRYLPNTLDAAELEPPFVNQIRQKRVGIKEKTSFQQNKYIIMVMTLLLARQRGVLFGDNTKTEKSDQCSIGFFLLINV